MTQAEPAGASAPILYVGPWGSQSKSFVTHVWGVKPEIPVNPVADTCKSVELIKLGSIEIELASGVPVLLCQLARVR